MAERSERSPVGPLHYSVPLTICGRKAALTASGLSIRARCRRRLRSGWSKRSLPSRLGRRAAEPSTDVWAIGRHESGLRHAGLSEAGATGLEPATSGVTAGEGGSDTRSLGAFESRKGLYLRLFSSQALLRALLCICATLALLRSGIVGRVVSNKVLQEDVPRSWLVVGATRDGALVYEAAGATATRTACSRR